MILNQLGGVLLVIHKMSLNSDDSYWPKLLTTIFLTSSSWCCWGREGGSRMPAPGGTCKGLQPQLIEGGIAQSQRLQQVRYEWLAAGSGTPLPHTLPHNLPRAAAAGREGQDMSTMESGSSVKNWRPSTTGGWGYKVKTYQDPKIHPLVIVHWSCDPYLKVAAVIHLGAERC